LRRSAEEGAGFCCQVPANPASYLLQQEGFRSRVSTRLSSEETTLSNVVVGNYCNGPITAEPCRAKTHPLRPRRSYFAPIGSARGGEEMVEAPGTAPGSDGFITMAIYRHSRCRQGKYRPRTAGMQIAWQAQVAWNTGIPYTFDTHAYRCRNAQLSERGCGGGDFRSGTQGDCLRDFEGSKARRRDVGTGGLRRFRFGRPGSGKSGGFRILSYYISEDFPVFLIGAFAKGDKANLTANERNEIAKRLKAMTATYNKRSGKR
jgi:hypothetical protein